MIPECPPNEARTAFWSFHSSLFRYIIAEGREWIHIVMQLVLISNPRSMYFACVLLASPRKFWQCDLFNVEKCRKAEWGNKRKTIKTKNPKHKNVLKRAFVEVSFYCTTFLIARQVLKLQFSRELANEVAWNLFTIPMINRAESKRQHESDEARSIHQQTFARCKRIKPPPSSERSCGWTKQDTVCDRPAPKDRKQQTMIDDEDFRAGLDNFI